MQVTSIKGLHARKGKIILHDDIVFIRVNCTVVLLKYGIHVILLWKSYFGKAVRIFHRGREMKEVSTSQEDENLTLAAETRHRCRCLATLRCCLAVTSHLVQVLVKRVLE